MLNKQKKSLFVLLILGIAVITHGSFIFSLNMPSVSAAAGLQGVKDGLKSIAESTQLNTGGADAGTGTFITAAGSVIKALLTFLGSAFIILVLWAGAKWMFSMGEAEKIKESIKIIRAASIGLAVIILSYAIVSFVLGLLGTGLGGGNGTTVSCTLNTGVVACRTINDCTGSSGCTCKIIAGQTTGQCGF